MPRVPAQRLSEKNRRAYPQFERARRLMTGMDAWVGSRIRQKRNLLGYSLLVTAERTGINRNRLLRLEKGDSVISPGDLHALAILFEVHPGWFFEGGGTSHLRLPEEKKDPESLVLAMSVPAFKDLVTMFSELDPAAIEHVRFVIEAAHAAMVARGAAA